MSVTTHASAVPAQKPQLRVDVFDARMQFRHEISTVAAQARLLEVRESTLHRIRAGKVTPNLATAWQMARAAGMSVDELFGLNAKAPRQRRAAAA